ncbi:MAG TPA: hypothetical protein VMG59_03225 [Phycisphaerae bacterium]|nr:hypothetical protein [Phycisphaerae bacterium]
MRYVFAIVSTVVLTISMVAVFTYLVWLDRKETRLDFSSYPQVVRDYLYQQTRGGWAFDYDILLAVSTFPDSEKVADFCLVTNSGMEVNNARDSISLAIKHGDILELSKEVRFGLVRATPIELGTFSVLSGAEVQNLCSTIQQLPANDESLPPLNRLVVVSFNNGIYWVTRIYDLRNLPNAMNQIDLITNCLPSTQFMVDH